MTGLKVTAIDLLAVAEDVGKAGPVGLFLILSLLIVVFFLGRSMRTHLRRVPLEFPPPDSPEPDSPETRTQTRTQTRHPTPHDRVIDGEILEEGPDSPRPRTD